MRTFALTLGLGFCLLLLSGVASANDRAGGQLTLVAVGDWPALALRPFAPGFNSPVHITHAHDDSGRLFIVEQPGIVRIVKNGVLLPAPFLDIHDRVSCCGEQGLLSLAFPPDFPGKGYLYVNYTDGSGDTIVARMRVRPDNLNQVDPASEQVVLRVAQPYGNHNGGQIAFSPRDGYLYIGMGDGGDAGDPHNYGQSPATLLGKMLRIDVESGVEPYAIPATNPFTATADYRGEIWALGLRNPWRFAFDRLSGDLFVGDVGQYAWEEINYQPAGSPGGENYGWRLTEGNHCFQPPNCDPAGLTGPVAEYDHSLGCAVTGGHVYGGDHYQRMRGVYFYADYCSGRIWGLRRQSGAWSNQVLLDAPFPISAFGEDQAGELYVADYRNGIVYELTESHRLWLPVWVHF